MALRLRFAASIRTKLLLVALTLLLIPWMGYQYVREMKSFLLQGQEDALVLTARAIATVLHDRPELFNTKAGVPDLVGEGRDLFAYPLARDIQLDGHSDDWKSIIDQARQYTDDYRLQCGPTYDPASLSFWNLLGYRGRYLYVLFKVHDDHVVFRDLRYSRLDTADSIRMTLENPDGGVKRYAFVGAAPGRMSVYQMDRNWEYPSTGDPIYSLRAVWQLTAGGYTVEMRIPRFMFGPESRMAFSVVDVDDPWRRTVARVISTSPQPGADKLGRVLLQSPEITKILKGLDKPASRIWILDKELRVRAVVGSLRDPHAHAAPAAAVPAALARLHELLNPIYRLIVQPPSEEFHDLPEDTTHRSDPVLAKVLTGQPQTERRPSLDRRTQILMAAYPILSDDAVIGAVAVEQTSNAVMALQNQVLENVISITLLVFLLVTIALITFASRLTLRIRRLRNAADSAISPEGRLRKDHVIAETRSGDEIGDLSRSISGMLQRLRQHTRYLEAMPDTLAHELSNPLNVVNSSLDNLQKLVQTQPDTHKYIDRAKNGITRLGSILTNLTEAANLEDALNADTRERFNLDALVADYVEGYRQSHPDRGFVFLNAAGHLPVDGSPDHVAQMLDKLIDNAVDFGDPQAPIEIRLQRDGAIAHLRVLNSGPPLPENMKERLFDPMVSIGKKRANQSRLGLGLYVVRLIAEFHRARVEAANRTDAPGAVFTVTFPLAGGD